jgi:hypothetical protein
MTAAETGNPTAANWFRTAAPFMHFRANASPARSATIDRPVTARLVTAA